MRDLSNNTRNLWKEIMPFALWEILLWIYQDLWIQVQSLPSVFNRSVCALDWFTYLRYQFIENTIFIGEERG